MSTPSSGGEPERPAFAPPVAPEPRLGTPPARATASPPPAGPPEHGDDEPGADRRLPTPWPWWTAFAALATGWFGGQVLASIVVVAADPGAATEDDLPIGLQVAAQLLFSACLIGAAFFFARLGGRITADRFGLRATHIGRALLWMVAGFFAFTLIGGLWLELTGAQDEQDTITETLTDNPSTATIVGLAFLTVVIAPIVEEVVFRGFVFTALRSAMNVPVAAVVSGVLFGVVHVFGSPWQFLVPLALLGTVLALIYWRTGSLYPCIALHAFNNCIAFGTARDWGWEILVLLGASGAAISAILALAVRLSHRAAQPA